MMGLARLVKRSAILSKQTGAPLLKELCLTFRVRPKLSMNWQDWTAFRFLGKQRFARDYIRKLRYFRWGFSVNPREKADLLTNKRLTFERLSDLMGRPCCATKTSTVEEMLAFWQEHKTLFLKPLLLTAGEGIEVLPSTLSEAEMRAKVAAYAGEPFLLEPYLRAHPVLQAVMPDSLSSLRIHTIRHGDEVRLCLLSSIRFGRKGQPGDHDPKSYTLYFNHEGQAIHPKAYSEGRLVERHEDTGYRFEQFRLPDWEASVALVKRAARRIPEHAFIGWDVALTPTGPQIIEANYLSGAVFNLQHFLHLTGLGDGVKRELLALRRFARTGKRPDIRYERVN